MSIDLISKIKPKNNGAFPVYDDIDGYGGFQVRLNITDRNNIPTLNRKEGMLVYTQADGYYWKLGSGLTNIDWTIATFTPPVISLSGDITGPTTSTVISNSVVTYNKIQNISAGSRLLGSSAAGPGAVQEIILGANLSMSGNTLNATGGGGGPSQNLFQTLSLGNSTDGYNIIVSSGDVITLTDMPVNPTDAANKAYVDGYGINLTKHAALRQLIHLADGGGPFESFTSNAYREVTGTAFPTSIIWYTNNTKTNKIISKDYTYNDAFPNSITWKVYDTDGSTVLATVTDTLTYINAFEVSRIRTIA